MIVLREVTERRCVEERIYRMLGRGGGDDRGGEVIDAPPEEAAERVVVELEEADLL
ncbi:hypothetical protein [Natronobeatus ordinarius]|uniref:hypothetical protein n=1 Tax=Natronobeatus ordinarius TaxID=2963433 RepID=UPI0020CCC2DB|nr:hypothetical protein [Natronobeatus ordinarius]